MAYIPVTIVTGFLGSGKTTLIQNMVKSVWDYEKVAIIKNEVSDVGVDTLELSHPKLTITELPNGCICCTLVGSLSETLKELIAQFHPDRIIIEGSGLAKPAQIVISLDLAPDVYVDGVIVVVDALNYRQLTDIEKCWSAQVQTEFIDMYIINKIDQVVEAECEIIEDDIFGIHPTARVIRSAHAEVPTSVLFGLHHNFIASEINQHIHEHNHISDYESFMLTNVFISSLEYLEQKLSLLPKSIYRSKGFFSLNEVNYIYNYVAGKTYLKETLNDIPVGSKMLFIGKDILKYEENVKKMFSE